MVKVFDTIIVTTAADYKRIRPNLNRLIGLLPGKRIIFIGNSDVKKYMEEDHLTPSERCGFMDENDILPFNSVNKCMEKLLNATNIPRGLTGWYYQQFLKMSYSYHSRHPYYLSWDGDTVPCKAFEMFDSDTHKPFFDMKYENHEEYFITLNKLFPSMGKIINRSFISEHMLFNCEFMNELIDEISSLTNIPGNTYYEKILASIRIEALQSNSFSEFETYGTYVSIRHPGAYSYKDWHSIRYGSIYFKAAELTSDDYAWIGRDFDAISFEKRQEYNPEIAALFTDPRYRSQLTARQIIEAIQDNSEGMREEWND